MFISIPFPSTETFFRESKDSAELPWEVLLEIEREHSLLHVCADLSKDHGSEGGWVVLSATETSRQILPSANYAPIDHKEKKISRGTKFSGNAVTMRRMCPNELAAAQRQRVFNVFIFC